MKLLLLVQVRVLMIKCHKKYHLRPDILNITSKWTFYLLDSLTYHYPDLLVTWYFVMCLLLIHEQTKTDTKENIKPKGQTKYSSFTQFPGALHPGRSIRKAAGVSHLSFVCECVNGGDGLRGKGGGRRGEGV